MNKTASLIIRILALLAAIAAGVAWYHIYDNNIKVALEKTKWLTDDPEIKAGDKFTERIEVLDSKLKDLLNAKREEIKTLTTNLDAANATIAQRDQTIKERNATISQLETERADLIRRRDELTSQLQQAVAKSEQVQGELDRATADIARKTEQINAMFSKEQYDEQVAAVHKAEDNLQKVVGRYTKLYNWVQEQNGVKPPPSHTRNPLEEEKSGPKVSVGELPVKYPTKVIAIDRRRGLLTLTIGQDNAGFAPGQIYDVELSTAAIGKIRIVEVRSGMTLANILPDTDHKLLNKDASIFLIRAQAKPVATEVAPVISAPAAPAAEAAAPAAQPEAL